MRASWKTAIAVGMFVVVALAILLAKQRTAGESAPAETHVSAATAQAPAAPAAPAPASTGGMPPLPAAVDLDALQKKLPDNLYWSLGMPTKDPATLERRAVEEREWNALFGKVQSNTATEPEIAKYYDHRRKLSHDYAELSRTILADYGKNLDEQHQGIFDMAARMNEQRLKQLPVEESRAVARRQARTR